MNKILLIFLASVSASYATIRHVSTSGSHATPFDTPAKAATNIQAAVDVAVAGDVVLLANGEYLLSDSVAVAKAIRIKGGGGPANAVVDGNGLNPCFVLDDVAVILDGLTITNGFNSGDGGGIACGGYLPMITNCVIIGNQADYGGGTINGTLSHCILKGNIAQTQGGGAYASHLNNCLVVSNSVVDEYGGGVMFGVLYNCTVAGNTATDAGGVSDSTVFNSIIYMNTAPFNMDTGFSELYYCCTTDGYGNTGANTTTNNPLFSDSLAGNYRLQAVSPCIDAGNNAHVSCVYDLDGSPRMVGGIVDLGAYESQFEKIWITGQRLPTGFLIEWPSLSGQACQVLWSASLTNGFVPVGPVVVHPQHSYTDTVHSAAAAGFYKVQVQLQ